MNGVLEIQMDADIIQKLENYANKINTTVADLMREYASSLTKKQEDDERFAHLSPRTRKMIGIVKVPDEIRNMDTKELIRHARWERYLEKNLH